MDNKKILDVTNSVKWIGILDPGLITFDVVMETKYGSTYNSYFIDAEKKTIVETAKESFKDEYLDKVKNVVNPEEIEYIIINHTEPDHSGSLRHLLRIAPNATVVGSRGAINFLKGMLDVEFKNKVVSHGDTLDLGNKTLRFIGAPFLHWPDSMYTYLEEEKILFTCDSFGCHFCDERMFDDLVDNFDDAFHYYYQVILSPFSNYMLEAIDKIRDLDINIVAPGHGPILRENWKKYVEMSEKLAKEALDRPKKETVFIPYVSAYGNTEQIAKNIKEGIQSVGDIDVEIMDVEMADISDVSEKIEKSTAIIIGSPTINQNTLPPIYKVFAVINPITNRGKLAGAFGSYGWSGEAVKIIQENMKNLKLKVYDEEGLKIHFIPFEEALQKAKEYGQGFGKKLLEMTK